MLSNPFTDQGSDVRGTAIVTLAADIAAINDEIDHYENFEAYEPNPMLGDLYELRNRLQTRLDRLYSRGLKILA